MRKSNLGVLGLSRPSSCGCPPPREVSAPWVSLSTSACLPGALLPVCRPFLSAGSQPENPYRREAVHNSCGICPISGRDRLGEFLSFPALPSLMSRRVSGHPEQLCSLCCSLPAGKWTLCLEHKGAVNSGARLGVQVSWGTRGSTWLLLCSDSARVQ